MTFLAILKSTEINLRWLIIDAAKCKKWQKIDDYRWLLNNTVNWASNNTERAPVRTVKFSVGLPFTEQTVSEHIWYLWTFRMLDSAFSKLRGRTVFIRWQKEWQRFVNFMKGLHDLFCKLHTTQESWNKMFCSSSLVKEKKKSESTRSSWRIHQSLR